MKDILGWIFEAPIRFLDAPDPYPVTIAKLWGLIAGGFVVGFLLAAIIF